MPQRKLVLESTVCKIFENLLNNPIPPQKPHHESIRDSPILPNYFFFGIVQSHRIRRYLVGKKSARNTATLKLHNETFEDTTALVVKNIRLNIKSPKTNGVLVVVRMARLLGPCQRSSVSQRCLRSQTPFATTLIE